MSKRPAVIFGNFLEIDRNDTVTEHLSLSFHATTLNLDELWQNSTLSAKFLSTFWGNFFPQTAQSMSPKKRVEDDVRFISSELLGNAVKFSYRPEYMVKICLFLSEGALWFYVTNSIGPEQVNGFQAYIQTIQYKNAEQLFLEQLEQTAIETRAESRIGYLTMLKDYNVELAWKFEEKKYGITVVTVMVRLPVVYA